MSLTSALLGYTNAIRNKIDEIISDKNTIGIDGVKGTVYRNVFKGFIASLVGTAVVEGDVPASPTFANDSSIYLHIKLPYNVTLNTGMFWLNVTGYSFGSAQLINTTAGGYSYLPTNQLLNTQISSVQTTELYVDASGNVVLSILFPSIYYTTIEIDSMVVGNGQPIKRGMLTAKYSKSNRVVF